MRQKTRQQTGGNGKVTPPGNQLARKETPPDNSKAPPKLAKARKETLHDNPEKSLEAVAQGKRVIRGGPKYKFRFPPGSLSDLREKHGLSQPDMAKKLGVILKTYINWERGRHGPNKGALEDPRTGLLHLKASHPVIEELQALIKEVQARGQPNKKAPKVDEIQAQETNEAVASTSFTEHQTDPSELERELLMTEHLISDFCSKVGSKRCRNFLRQRFGHDSKEAARFIEVLASELHLRLSEAVEYWELDQPSIDRMRILPPREARHYRFCLLKNVPPRGEIRRLIFLLLSTNFDEREFEQAASEVKCLLKPFNPGRVELDETDIIDPLEELHSEVCSKFFWTISIREFLKLRARFRRLDHQFTQVSRLSLRDLPDSLNRHDDSWREFDVYDFWRKSIAHELGLQVKNLEDHLMRFIPVVPV